MSSALNANNPRSMFYWNDWAKDPCLRLCGHAAKGLWMDLMAFAANCEPFGHLSVNGRALSLDNLSSITGCPAAELGMLLKELEGNGVFSRDAKGRIYSRRMVRDFKAVNESRKNGKKGGNPSIGRTREKSQGVNPPVIPPVNPNTYTHTFTPHPPKGGGRRYEAENTDGAPPWGRRVAGFCKNGFWISEWGPKPGEAECLVPPEFLSPPNHPAAKG